MAATQSAGAARFSCPPDYTAMPPASEPRFSLEKLSDPDTQLWLIQAPADFAPDCLNGRLVPLSGSHRVKGKLAGQRLRYQILSSSSSPGEGEATLLAPSAHAGGELTCAPAPQGSLRIFEGPQKSLSGTPLQPIPTIPPPQIPPGLRPRFCAFGGQPPVTGLGSTLALKSPGLGKRKKQQQQLPEASASQEAVNGYGALEVDTTSRSLKESVGKKKKKQPAEVMEPVVTEPTAEMLEPVGVLVPSTTKKRKKKPKGAEAVDPQVGVPEPEGRAAEPELRVKTESSEETAPAPSKKRKRKKEAEVELVEETVVESQPQVKVELQEEAIPLPPRKKKKKEKRQSTGAEPGPEAVEPESRPLVLHPQGTEPELPGDIRPQAEAALVSTKKRKKKEKGQNEMLEPGTEVAEPELPGDLEPQVAPASTKKKREKGHKMTSGN